MALALSGCGAGDKEPAGPLPSARYAIPSSAAPVFEPVVPSATATADAQASVGPAADTAAARRKFKLGMAAYCTSYFTLQREAEDAHPAGDLASQVLLARAETQLAELTDRRLEKLRPPADLVEPFEHFVETTDRMTVARGHMAEALAATGGYGQAGNEFDQAVTERRELGAELAAPRCDGRLPAAEKASAIEAVRTFETTPDSAAACGELATPGFLQTRWYDLPDPLAGCIESREHNRTGGFGLPTDIVVGEVTGSDGLVATVRYAYVGGCPCGELAFARLHLVDGRWLVSNLQYG